MLFHEIYGSYYRVTSEILGQAAQGTLTGKSFRDLVSEKAFGESILTIPEGMTGEKWRLLHRDYSTSLEEIPELPLTELEKRWMKAVLLDPRMRLFDPDTSGLEDVPPLFTPDRVVYYDRYSNGDPFEDPDYIRNFRTVLQALREGRMLSVTFRSRGKSRPLNHLYPVSLEYSEKDDRFRLNAASRYNSWIINIGRMESCSLEEESHPVPLKKREPKSVTFLLENRRNALERVLLHFSHLEKETRRLENGTYQVTLKYDRQDETEMLIRILSFGPLVRVISPDSFITLLRERIEKQRTLQQSAGEKPSHPEGA